MTGGPRMHCPECGDDAVRQRPADRMPWAAHGLPQPQWSHRDGTSLCPVIGPAGYQPAQPRPAEPAASPRGLRPEPPQSADAGRGDVGEEDGTPAGRTSPERPAGTAGPLGRAYLAGVIARLGDPRQAGRDREPEAGG